jgi:hypothetical protein
MCMPVVVGAVACLVGCGKTSMVLGSVGGVIVLVAEDNSRLPRHGASSDTLVARVGGFDDAEN